MEALLESVSSLPSIPSTTEAEERLALYKYRLESYLEGFQKQQKRTKVCCGVALVLYIVLALTMGTLLFMSLYFLPLEAKKLQNMKHKYSWNFTGGMLPNGTCTTFCDTSFACGSVRTTNWEMPTDWDDLSAVDDVLVEVTYGTIVTKRIFLTISSNGILWHSLELVIPSCGTCDSKTQFVHGVFHITPGWQPSPQNNITFDAGPLVCFTSATASMRYSKLLFQNYQTLIDGLFWGGIAAALLTVLLPSAFFGHLIQVCCRSNSEKDQQWLDARLQAAENEELRHQVEGERLLPITVQ